MTQSSRSTDKSLKAFSRSDRLFLNSGLWYFHTREGTEVGPFRYRKEAEAMLQHFITRIQTTEQQKQMAAGGKLHFRVPALVGTGAEGVPAASGQMS